MKKNFLIVIISFFLFTSLVLAESDFSFISRENIRLDESLTSVSSVNYQRPQQIFVSHIKPAHGYLLNDTANWMRLFHYYITTRLELPDMPFNYVIDSSGDIYEVIEDAEGRVSYMDIDEGAVMIGYLSESSDLTPSAQRAFKSLIETYSYKFGISKSQVQPVDFVISQDSSLPSYERSESFFKENFLSMIEKFEYSQESNLRFSGEIIDLNYEKTVESGDELEISFILKNTDAFSWYIDEGFVFLSTADGQESPFAINQVWDSFSKPLALEEQILLPGDEIEVSFKIGTEGVLPDKHEASFKFVMLPEIDVEGTEFTVEFEIDKGDCKVVQIRPTNTGALTVYGCPSYTCEMVAGANSGERYLVVDEEDAWYKISIEGVEGWVTIHYATPVD